MKKIYILLGILIILGLLTVNSRLQSKVVLAATWGCCPPGSPISCCAGGGGGGQYTYDCDNCAGEPSPSGKCCIHWESDSCGCPSYTGCDGDECWCTVGACGGDDDDDCSQPCGSCFPCDACATQGGLPEQTPLMMSFEEAKFGQVSDEEIAQCQQSLISSVNASEADKVISSLNTPFWKLALQNTIDWFSNHALWIVTLSVTIGLAFIVARLLFNTKL